MLLGPKETPNGLSLDYGRISGGQIKASILQELVRLILFFPKKSSSLPMADGSLWYLSADQSPHWSPPSSVSQASVTHFRVHASILVLLTSFFTLNSLQPVGFLPSRHSFFL